MSIDFLVYSEQSAAPDPATLAAALLRKGWHVFFWNQNIVYGARDAAVLARVRDCLEKGNLETLEVLFEEDKVGACRVVTGGFNSEEELGEDMAATLPAGVVSLLRKSRSRCAVTTNMGRGETAFELQVAVWEAFGEIVDGLLEDPQSGRFLRMGPRGREILYEAEIEKGSPVDTLIQFFDAAKAEGFPLEAKPRDEVNLNTALLDPGGLERLLSFTKNYFPPGDLTGSAMVLMILEDYEIKKGLAFSQEHAGWFKEMRMKYGEL